MFTSFLKITFGLAMLCQLTGCSRSEVPILDLIHDRASAPYVCWINGEPAIYVMPPFRGSWYGFPIVKKRNRLKFDRLGEMDVRFVPPELRLRYLGAEGEVDLKASNDGAEFDADRSEVRQNLQPIPSGFNAASLSRYVNLLFRALESGNREEVDRLFQTEEGSKIFPRWIFDGALNPAQGKSVDREFTLLKGRHLILLYSKTSSTVRAGEGGRYLLQLKNAKSEFALEWLSFCYNERGDLCIYSVDSAVLGKSPLPVLKLP